MPGTAAVKDRPANVVDNRHKCKQRTTHVDLGEGDLIPYRSIGYLVLHDLRLYQLVGL